MRTPVISEGAIVVYRGGEIVIDMGDDHPVWQSKFREWKTLAPWLQKVAEREVEDDRRCEHRRKKSGSGDCTCHPTSKRR